MSKGVLLEDRLKRGKPIKLRQSIEIQFQGDKLEQLRESNKQFQMRLTESAGKAGEQRKLRVVVEGIHTGMTKNLTFYPGSELEASVPTWTTPHKKPVLKNHNTYSEPLGRIVHAEYAESTLTDKYTVRLTLELTDQDAIDKVLDGRYLTLSVGGSANKVSCSICAKDLVSEGFCGHYRGRTYEGKKAHWIIGQYTGEEISFVNMPADVFSQVIAAELVSEGGKPVNKGKSQEDAAAGKTTESEDDILSQVDNLLNEGAKGSDDSDNSGNEDPSHQAENEDDDNVDNVPVSENEDDDDNSDNDEPSNPTGNESVEDLKRQLQESQDKIAELENELTAAEANNVALSTEVKEQKERIAALESDLTTAQEAVKVAEAEVKTFTEQNVRLAQFIRKSLVEQVVDLRIAKGLTKADERETALAEWSGCSTKVLQGQIEELQKMPRKPAHVSNPGYVTDNNDATDDEGNYVAEGSKKSDKPVTFGDLEEAMISSIFRGN